MLMKNLQIKIAYCLLMQLLFCTDIFSQLAVEQEPHHKLLFRNQYIHLLKGHVAAGDTTLQHIHAANSAVVFLTKTGYGIQNTGERATINEVNAGDMLYRAYGDKPVTHVVWDEGTTAFDFIVVELLQNHTADSCTLGPVEDLQLQWKNKSVQAFTLMLHDGQHYTIPASCWAYLLIDIDGNIEANTPSQTNHLKTEDAVYYRPHTTIMIQQRNAKNAHCVLLALK